MAEVIAQRGGFRPVVIKDTDDKVGIVTVDDGPSLVQGEIIAPIVGDDASQAETYHNNFQDMTTPRRPVVSGAVNYRCWWKARTISIACSLP